MCWFPDFQTFEHILAYFSGPIVVAYNFDDLLCNEHLQGFPTIYALTLSPSCAALMAATYPPGPEPITTKSA